LSSSFFSKKKDEEVKAGKTTEAEKKLKDQNKAERKAHVAELNAVKKQAAEMSVDLYLERSFREYIVTSKGIKEGKKPWGFSFPSFGRSNGASAATTGNGIAGFITKFLGRDEVSPPASDSSDDDNDEVEAGSAIPEPIGSSRPIMTVPVTQVPSKASSTKTVS